MLGTPAIPDRGTVSLSLLIVRVVAGVIFAIHGAQKLFGAFGGSGLEATVAQMNAQLNLGYIAYAVVIGEFFGGCALILGLLSRFSALSLIVIMGGAIAKVHAPNGFFQQAGGFEYNVALIGLLLPTLLAGPGSLSLSHCLFRSRTTGRPIVVLE